MFSVRQAVKLSRPVARTFASSSTARKDFVQDLYIKELKSYKAPPTAKDAHVGNVKSFSAPQAPSAPSVPSDLASELSTYESSEPSKPEVTGSSGATHHASGKTEADAFLESLEADVHRAEAHH